MNNLQLRDACASDRDTIRAITLAAYEQYAKAMGEMWEFYRKNILETLADVAPAEQIVAETPDGIIGTVLLYPAGNIAHTPDGSIVTMGLPEIRLLAVTPRARGQGIAKALMEECVRRTRQAGVRALGLHTTDMMQIAMQMYERMGFVRDPERDFQPAENVLIKAFRLDLGNSLSPPANRQ